MQHRPQKRMEERVSLTHLFFTPGCDTGRKENCLGRLRQKSKSEEKRRDKKKGLPCLSVEEKVYDKGGFTLLTRLFKKFRPKKGPIIFYWERKNHLQIGEKSSHEKKRRKSFLEEKVSLQLPKLIPRMRIPVPRVRDHQQFAGVLGCQCGRRLTIL